MIAPASDTYHRPARRQLVKSPDDAGRFGRFGRRSVGFLFRASILALVAHDLLTTRQAADLLGVSPSSVKRWADEGLLVCIKTVGSHRRFDRVALERFRDVQAPLVAVAAETAGEIDGWIEALCSTRPPQAFEAKLLDLRGRKGSWVAAATFLGDVLNEVGRRWEAGRLGVLEEHLAAERLERAVTSAGAWVPLPSEAPRALLLTAEGDDHTLGLALAELCLRELGFATLWAGRSTPIDLIARVVRLRTLHAVGVSASRFSSDPGNLERQAGLLAELCAPYSVRLVFGGEGAWPERPAYGTRLHGFGGLADAVR
jgi:excisionase family DNA binding protein